MIINDNWREWHPNYPKTMKYCTEINAPGQIFRCPSQLIRECQIAFDEELYIASLTLCLTIPDVCSSSIKRKTGGVRTQYITWCNRYLFPSDSFKEDFTAIDLYALRCSIVHSQNSILNKGNKTKFDCCGVAVTGNVNNLLIAVGTTCCGFDGNKPENSESHIAKKRISLDALVFRMTDAVKNYLNAFPNQDTEQSLQLGSDMCGILNYLSMPNS